MIFRTPLLSKLGGEEVSNRLIDAKEFYLAVTLPTAALSEKVRMGSRRDETKELMCINLCLSFTILALESLKSLVSSALS